MDYDNLIKEKLLLQNLLNNLNIELGNSALEEKKRLKKEINKIKEDIILLDNKLKEFNPKKRKLEDENYDSRILNILSRPYKFSKNDEEIQEEKLLNEELKEIILEKGNNEKKEEEVLKNIPNKEINNEEISKEIILYENLITQMNIDLNNAKPRDKAKISNELSKLREKRNNLYNKLKEIDMIQEELEEIILEKEKDDKEEVLNSIPEIIELEEVVNESRKRKFDIVEEEEETNELFNVEEDKNITDEESTKIMRLALNNIGISIKERYKEILYDKNPYIINYLVNQGIFDKETKKLYDKTSISIVNNNLMKYISMGQNRVSILFQNKKYINNNTINDFIKFLKEGFVIE